jgi:hypothetical protein
MGHGLVGQNEKWKIINYLAYWNEQKRGEKGAEENNKKLRPKLGLFAGDSCSRPKEAISQTLRFLDSIGFHEPTECLANNGGMSPTRRRNSAVAPKLIGSFNSSCTYYFV